MSAPTAAVPVTTTGFDDINTRRPLAATAGTYYPGEMLAVDASGNVTKCTDAAGLQFCGLQADSFRIEVLSGDAAGDHTVTVEQPMRFAMKIAAAAAGDEGKAVYAKFSNEVAYSGVSHSVPVGYVHKVVDATTVEITPVYLALVTAVAVAANTLTFSGTTGQNQIAVPDNLADALSIAEGANEYVTIKTTDGSETVLVKKNLDVVAGINLSGATTANVVSIPDNLADALNVKEGSNSYLKFVTTNSGEKIVPGKDIVSAAGLVSAAPTGTGVGYSTGAGGAVTQGTGRTTGVTTNTLAGAITLFSAAGSATPATFTVTNSTVAATDTVVVSQKSGTDAYSATVSAVAAGSFKVTIIDLTGTTTEAPVFNFAVVKAVAS